jgi:hypothetical protein
MVVIPTVVNLRWTFIKPLAKMDIPKVINLGGIFIKPLA